MPRFFCALFLFLGLVASAVAQESEGSRASSASVSAITAWAQGESGGASVAPAVARNTAVVASAASAVFPLASASASASVSVSADDGAVLGQMHRIRDMLTRKFGLAREKAERISSAVMSSASKYSLPPALVLAIISIESRFQDHARGAHGATGLMQVVPAAHKRLVKNLDLTEPAANIEAGSAILHGYIESARGDVSAALKSYGGSSAYARKVGLRAKDFQAVDAASESGTAPAQP